MQGKISKLHNMLVNREITAAELAEKYFDSIEKYDGTLNAYITVTKDEAMSQAKKVDEMIAEGKEIPMLAGIPMTIKDNISTKGILTSCASKILSNYKPVYNAFAAEQVLNSGAVLLGKTNLDEFGMGSGCENSYFGKTRNPRNPEFVPGGSSGGSAAGVAAGEFPFALGSDTGGSVRLPAAFCGVSAIRPTYGRVSRFGLVSFASSMDQIGIIAPKIYDLAMVLTEISGADEKDSTSAKLLVSPQSNYNIQHHHGTLVKYHREL